ncbi:MAG: hypothetical protein AB7S26_20100 [Sandaracinaceae bacterium]
MSLLDLGLLYLVVGIGCAAVVLTRSRGAPLPRIGSALLALLLWPMWLPLILIEDRPPPSRATDRAARIEEELTRSVDAARGSPFEVLLSQDAAEKIRKEVREALQRIAELDGVLAQPGFDRDEAERRVVQLTESRGSKRALRSAVLHRNNVARIEALRDRSVRGIEELSELAHALRSQLVLARYAGSSPEGVGGIVTEMWARVEGLGEALDAHEHPDLDGSDDLDAHEAQSPDAAQGPHAAQSEALG